MDFVLADWGNSGNFANLTLEIQFTIAKQQTEYGTEQNIS